MASFLGFLISGCHARLAVVRELIRIMIAFAGRLSLHRALTYVGRWLAVSLLNPSDMGRDHTADPNLALVCKPGNCLAIEPEANVVEPVTMLVAQSVEGTPAVQASGSWKWHSFTVLTPINHKVYGDQPNRLY
ncbi:hypothetical protein BDN67DRAFT_974884 [Paxillus ammoniavirescens]|nr:hypothetical protein BDN67DRAFT_974884 [Paxillus ammoniavirescens]